MPVEFPSIQTTEEIQATRVMQKVIDGTLIHFLKGFEPGEPVIFLDLPAFAFSNGSAFPCACFVYRFALSLRAFALSTHLAALVLELAFALHRAALGLELDLGWIFMKNQRTRVEPRRSSDSIRK